LYQSYLSATTDVDAADVSAVAGAAAWSPQIFKGESCFWFGLTASGSPRRGMSGQPFGCAKGG